MICGFRRGRWAADVNVTATLVLFLILGAKLIGDGLGA